MSGGFIVEASDDEDEDTTSGEADGRQSDTREQSELRNGTGHVASAAPTPSSRAPFLTAISPSALLEARIREDPRGDMDAWLNLIADCRRNSKVDEVRSVYNRFVKVFPQAVSSPLLQRCLGGHLIQALAG